MKDVLCCLSKQGKSGKGSCTTASSVSISVYQNCNVVCPGIEMAGMWIGTALVPAMCAVWIGRALVPQTALHFYHTHCQARSTVCQRFQEM
jgi:hypothetical protein